MKKLLSIAFLFSSHFAGAADVKYDEAAAKKIIETAESLRTLDQAKSVVQVTTQSDSKKTVYEMNVLQSTGRRAYMEFLEPAEERGRRMLALKTQYWSKFPDSTRVVSISRKEMIGNSAFAIADVFQMDTANDYKPEVLGKQDIEGKACFQLLLTARHSDAPYSKIHYYVQEKDSYPVKADFFGASGKPIKTMVVLQSKVFAGKLRPSEFKMVDQVTQGKVSWWLTKTINQNAVPDDVFSVSYLKGR